MFFSAAILLFGTFPAPSLGQNSTAQNGGINGRFLIKSHAILMTLAWLMFAPMAILFARFQRDPLRRFLGEQLWFQVHRLFNTLTVFCALLAFVCILSAMGGRWVGPKAGSSLDWGSIHALFGLISVLLALSQPMSALFRCHPDSSSRQIFNIWHSASGYLAWICAALAITIACLSFPMYASQTVVAILIIAFLALLLLCFFLMQFLAIQKAQLQIIDAIGQGHLFVAAAFICVSSALAISLSIIFA